MLTEARTPDRSFGEQQTPNNPFQVPVSRRSSPYWQDDAACRTEDSELFFPPMHAPRREKRAAERRAKRYCRSCPVQAECLEAALEAEERHGIWGGMTPRERRRMFGTDRNSTESKN